MKIGIMGGTFNPIHNGHIEMACKAAEEFKLDDILLIPAGNPPHKADNPVLSKYDRYEMCLVAAAPYDNIIVSSIEIERDSTTYTIDTLKELEVSYGIRDGIYFIIGGDTVFQLETWRDFREVFKRCGFIAFKRSGLDPGKMLGETNRLKSEYGIEIFHASADISPFSSSDIRKRISRGDTIQGMVPASVEEYIRRHNLYK
ncbi:MAG: nicotinate-nucleotide adenylyltransferase [Clostridia bacterium]|nr:nicotinate-nucleotide adenylyltransferase [Clostridia bacterium]